MLRFTIRDLLWLTVVLALATVWWVDRRAKNEAQASLAAARQELASIRSILSMGGLEETVDDLLDTLQRAQRATPSSVRVKKSLPSP